MKEYQKKRIQYKLSLNFEEELIKSKQNQKRKIFHKTFLNELDILIPQFYRDGIQFYGFTIDLLYLREIQQDLWWENVHEDVETWVHTLGEKIELIEFCYISIELKKGNLSNSNSFNLPKLLGIIGVRTLLGENDFLDIQIKKQFRNCQEWEDIAIKRLLSLTEIKNYWNFVIKENNFKFHRFARYGEQLKYNDIYGTIAQTELIYDEPHRFAFDLSIHLGSLTFDITGVKIKNPNPKTLVIYLLTLFFWHRGYKIYKSEIYQQIKGSMYSWKMVNSLKFLKENNIFIFEYLKSLYPQQLEEINTMEIINSSWNETIDEIMLNNQYLPKLEFKNDAMEFKDGVFFINANKFYSFKTKKISLDLIMINKNCCVYFKKCYRSLNKPKAWLNAISRILNSPEDFCINFGRHFHSDTSEKAYTFSEKALKLYMLDDDVFKHGIKKHEIKQYLSDIDIFFKKDLDKIIIYCNRLYLKKKMF